MIDQVRLKNFKCFREETVHFGGLTVLSGLNGSGKSSVIQAILALRQRCEPVWGSRWRGPLVDLGRFRDVLHSESTDSFVRLDISFFNGMGEMSLEDAEDGRSHESGIRNDDSLVEQWIKGELFYLSADRLGPRSTLPYLQDGHSSVTPLGTRGQHVLWYLDRFGDSSVHDCVLHSAEPKRTLSAQTNAWLSVISPGAELHINTIPEADIAVATFPYARPGDVLSSPFRAGNVGFGLSYGLPAIVSLLAPRQNPDSAFENLIIIENPEAHLHPGGQTSLAELAARAVRSGVQVILETHSDHILNGVRLAVADGILSPHQVAINYFERKGLEVRVTAPSLTSSGKLDHWPEGFFDQHERNLSRLIGLASNMGNQRIA